MQLLADDITFSNSTDHELQEWLVKRNRASFTNKVIWTSYCVIIFCATISMAVLVIGIRKRREFFSFATLFCFVIYSSVRLPYYILEDVHKLPLKAKPYVSITIQLFYILAHWAYSSQYIKTSVILPVLFEKTKLIVMRERASTIDSNLLQTRNSDFIEAQKNIDSIIKDEKVKIQKLQQKLIIVDLVAVIILVSCTLGYLLTHKDYYNNSVPVTVALLLITAIMAFFAARIGYIIKVATRTKPRNWLIYQHMINLVGLCLTEIIGRVLWR